MSAAKLLVAKGAALKKVFFATLLFISGLVVMLVWGAPTKQKLHVDKWQDSSNPDGIVHADAPSCGDGDDGGDGGDGGGGGGGSGDGGSGGSGGSSGL